MFITGSIPGLICEDKDADGVPDPVTPAATPPSTTKRPSALVAVIIAVVGLLASLNGTASVSLVGRVSAWLIGPATETRLGVQTHLNDAFVGSSRSVLAAHVGQTCPGFDGMTVGSCVATETGAAGDGSVDGAREKTPGTDPDRFRPVRGRSGKVDSETGEVWEKDKLRKDHYEVYKNQKDYEKGVRVRDVWADGRPKGTK